MVFHLSLSSCVLWRLRSKRMHLSSAWNLKGCDRGPRRVKVFSILNEPISSKQKKKKNNNNNNNNFSPKLLASPVPRCRDFGSYRDSRPGRWLKAEIVVGRLIWVGMQSSPRNQDAIVCHHQDGLHFLWRVWGSHLLKLQKCHEPASFLRGGSCIPSILLPILLLPFRKKTSNLYRLVNQGTFQPLKLEAGFSSLSLWWLVSTCSLKKKSTQTSCPKENGSQHI